MKTGKTLEALAAELTRQAASKKDYLAPLEALRFEPHPDHRIVLRGVNGGLPLRDMAHRQLAAETGIPLDYYRRMLADDPGLLAANANRWLSNTPVWEFRETDRHGDERAEARGRRKLVRTLDGSVRAVLSDSYRPLDNVDLAEAVLPKLVGLGATVASCEVTEDRFYLKAVTDRISGEVKKGDVVQAGVVVSNSEVGQGSLRVEELDYRLVCLNGMIRATAVRKAHLGRGARGQDAVEDAREYYRTETQAQDDKAFFMKVQDAVGAMFNPERFNRRLDQYREAEGLPIAPSADVGAVVAVTAKRFGLTDGERSSVLAHLIRGGDLSKWGLANAVTRAAQDVESYDRSTEIEQLGGAIIELPKHSWESIATATAA